MNPLRDLAWWLAVHAAAPVLLWLVEVGEAREAAPLDEVMMRVYVRRANQPRDSMVLLQGVYPPNRAPRRWPRAVAHLAVTAAGALVLLW